MIGACIVWVGIVRNIELSYYEQGFCPKYIDILRGERYDVDGLPS